MNNFDIYSDIAQRTNGSVYIGVVGPVRTGKSTFISKFMELLVLPNIQNENEKKRAVDELPQAADGRTVMTTQPKFVPNEPVDIKLNNIAVSLRLIDCVGYLVDEALDGAEGEKNRMVKTPWSNKEMPFAQAAELGTKKVIEDHSTVAIVVTNDGTITDIPRTSYVKAEEKVISELKALGKPFVVVLNSKAPKSEDAQKLRDSLAKKYGVSVIAANAKSMNEKIVAEIFEAMLYEFPLSSVRVNIPKWMQTLDGGNSVISEILSSVSERTKDMTKMKDYHALEGMLENSPNMNKCEAITLKMGQGVIECDLNAKQEIFFRVLSEEAKMEITDDFSLMRFIKQLSHAKSQYDRVHEAMKEAGENGYGVVLPSLDDMEMETPEIFRQGAQYGVKLKASAPTLHIMKVDVKTEVAPIVGSLQQSEYLLNEFDNNPKGIWEANMFGKPMSSLAKEDMCNKISAMPDEVQKKLRKTVGRIVNENKGGLICVLL